MKKQKIPFPFFFLSLSGEIESVSYVLMYHTYLSCTPHHSKILIRLDNGNFS